jgi:hypothetical protein
MDGNGDDLFSYSYPFFSNKSGKNTISFIETITSNIGWRNQNTGVLFPKSIYDNKPTTAIIINPQKKGPHKTTGNQV